ncbi:MAG: hypothetical protein SFW66_02765 [Gammaproteobacteria bacterium]|nr:hypothetical protein [Gammaproteobacteria bacterium]
MGKKNRKNGKLFKKPSTYYNTNNKDMFFAISQPPEPKIRVETAPPQEEYISEIEESEPNILCGERYAEPDIQKNISEEKLDTDEFEFVEPEIEPAKKKSWCSIS